MVPLIWGDEGVWGGSTTSSCAAVYGHSNTSLAGGDGGGESGPRTHQPPMWAGGLPPVRRFVRRRYRTPRPREASAVASSDSPAAAPRGAPGAPSKGGGGPTPRGMPLRWHRLGMQRHSPVYAKSSSSVGVFSVRTPTPPHPTPPHPTPPHPTTQHHPHTTSHTTQHNTTPPPTPHTTPLHSTTFHSTPHNTTQHHIPYRTQHNTAPHSPPHPTPPRMGMRELSRVCRWLRRSQHNTQHMQITGEREKLVKSRTPP